TLQEIGVVVGVTRERVRQIEKKIYAIKSNAVVDYRLEGAVAIEYEAANIPLLVKSELNNELSTLLCQSGSKFIVKDSPFVLVDFQNPRYDDFKEITELLGEAGEVDIDALSNVFESFKG
ncbi:sigma factor-like helix-turn-helix DNA-binding protein, partial [Lentilactobacillus kefiri]|uniref:sigma factor-like helix-turn-helix DNA-binding protein n=1 Tax=Lentilactobacillus kefiri TaxID=33962 RepID=UPI000BC80D9C